MVKYWRISAYVIAIAICALSVGAHAQSGGTATVTGTIVDQQTGKPIVGVSVFLVGTKLGGFANVKGKYTVQRVPAGVYEIQYSSVGYTKKRVANVTVADGEVKKVDITLEPESIETEEVVVEARVLRNNDISLLKSRQKASSVSDAISAEKMSQSGAGNAADAVGQITGASVVDGKYVYVRGLGDRYSNAQLNGATLPSTDPDRNTVSMDMFPAGFLENIVTVKTFTPDKPGNFTGGSVNINTKTFPEKFTFNISSSTSYNSQTTFSDDFLSQAGGDTDWLAFDDGARELPSIIADPNVTIPSLSSSFRADSSANALFLDEVTKSFNNEMGPRTSTAPVNQSLAVSIGGNTEVLKRPLGILASLNYKRSFSGIEDGKSERWLLPGSVEENDSLFRQRNLTSLRGSETAFWGGFLTLTMQLDNNNEVSGNFMYNQNANSSSTYFFGGLPEQLNENQTFERRVLQYTERNINTFQLSGEHFAEGLGNLKIDWHTSLTSTNQDEPDQRYFTNHFTLIEGEDGIIEDTTFSILSNYQQPGRFFRDLQEDVWDSKVDFELPFDQWSGLETTVKFGGAYEKTDREHNERRFQYGRTSSDVKYQGDPFAFFSGENIGIDESESTDRFFFFGNTIQETTIGFNTYTGEQEITAAYGMIDLPITKDLRFIGGARWEHTQLSVASQPVNVPGGTDGQGIDSVAAGSIDQNDILPSLNFVYTVIPNMNVRLAFTQTLARPTFREIAPFTSIESNGDQITGNPELERTLVQNYDIRWEWFLRPGEIVAVSGFYKDFENPIELVILNENGQQKYENVPEALVYGAEFEFRKALDDVAEFLKYMQFGMNLTLIKSEVDINPRELTRIRESDPNAESTRTLQGQSPFIFNFDLSYANQDMGTSVNVSFNIFGERLQVVSRGATPDIFEQPRGDLRASISQKLFDDRLKLKLSGSNLLNSDFKSTHDFNDTEYIYESYSKGTSVSFGVSYTIN